MQLRSGRIWASSSGTTCAIRCIFGWSATAAAVPRCLLPHAGLGCEWRRSCVEVTISPDPDQESAMARAIWKGSISFGLVHIPVGLFSAETRDEVSFRQLDKRNLAPVGYKKYNKQK